MSKLNEAGYTAPQLLTVGQGERETEREREREREFVRDAECIQNTEKVDILLNMAFDCFR